MIFNISLKKKAGDNSIKKQTINTFIELQVPFRTILLNETLFSEKNSVNNN